VSDQLKFRAHAERYGAMDAGYVSENIYLACTALGLNTVARAMMDAKVLSEKLGLAEHLVPMLNHPIGWPK
jgi:nitroreductase